MNFKTLSKGMDFPKKTYSNIFGVIKVIFPKTKYVFKNILVYLFENIWNYFQKNQAFFIIKRLFSFPHPLYSILFKSN